MKRLIITLWMVISISTISNAQIRFWPFSSSDEDSITGVWYTPSGPEYYIINEHNDGITGTYIGPIPVTTTAVAKISGYVDGNQLVFDVTNMHDIQNDRNSISISVILQEKYNLTLEDGKMKGNRDRSITSSISVDGHTPVKSASTMTFFAQRLKSLPANILNDPLFVYYLKSNNMLERYK